MNARGRFTVAALYRFARLADPAALRAPLLALAEAQGIKGTLLLAREGVNGTIAGSADGIASILEHIRALPGCADLDVKHSAAEEMPFGRLKVRVKREIVTMGEPDIDPLAGAGTYVSPQDWNALISDPEVIVIDTRNDYEVAVGTFPQAINPGTRTFREFPAWFRREREHLLAKPRKVAMFCTGGIRCEKSTAFLKAEGIEDVYHLQGGVLRYLEEVPPEQSLWQGECFVFDERVALGHGLAEGEHTLCRACGRAVAAGESCAGCGGED
ncbi:MAG: rhodanese-related sulfurtransferase [Novosphingobium sp.]|nr:rhodanese-related sulfurtransferase [Novosphingobium sp.]